MFSFIFGLAGKKIPSQPEIYFGYALSADHFTAGIKLIVRGRQKVVGLGDPIDAVNHQLTVGAGVIVVAVKLEQTRIIAAAMLIAVQHAVFADDTQSIGVRLGIRIRLGIGVRGRVGGRGRV